MFDKVIIIGIFISLIYSEITGFSPSGLIVPGYLAININNPSRIIFTLFVSLLTFVIVKIISKYAIIYGKRQFSLSVGISVILNLIIITIYPTSFGIIGNIIPGIISNEWLKEGVFVSLTSLALVVGLIILIMIGISLPVFRW